MTCRDIVIEKLTEMPQERVSKVLIFMAGMEAERKLSVRSGRSEESCKGSQQSA